MIHRCLILQGDSSSRYRRVLFSPGSPIVGQRESMLASVSPQSVALQVVYRVSMRQTLICLVIAQSSIRDRSAVKRVIETACSTRARKIQAETVALQAC